MTAHLSPLRVSLHFPSVTCQHSPSIREDLSLLRKRDSFFFTLSFLQPSFKRVKWPPLNGPMVPVSEYLSVRLSVSFLHSLFCVPLSTVVFPVVGFALRVFTSFFMTQNGTARASVTLHNNLSFSNTTELSVEFTASHFAQFNTNCTRGLKL